MVRLISSVIMAVSVCERVNFVKKNFISIIAVYNFGMIFWVGIFLRCSGLGRHSGWLIVIGWLKSLTFDEIHTQATSDQKTNLFKFQGWSYRWDKRYLTFDIELFRTLFLNRTELLIVCFSFWTSQNRFYKKMKFKFTKRQTFYLWMQIEMLDYKRHSKQDLRWNWGNTTNNLKGLLRGLLKFVMSAISEQFQSDFI